MAHSDRFLKACRKEISDCTPVWLLSQSGPYLSDYRKLREEYTLIDMIKTAELAAQATLFPVDIFDLDAAILFSDILPILEAMGLRSETGPQGPQVINPIESHADIESLVIPEGDSLQFTIRAIQLCVGELEGLVPVIGFAGAPFTMACYGVEGGLSARFIRVKSLMYEDTQWWHKLMDKFSTQAVRYMGAQVYAGAKAVQLFDSFVGILSPYDFREYVLPHLQRLVNSFKDAHPNVPIIYYGTDSAGFLPLIAETGCDVISVDWRIELTDAWAQLGDDVAVQGNLDPTLLLGSTEEMERQVARLLDAVAGRPGHILNLGHSLLANTPVKNVEALVNFVHDYSAKLIKQ